MDARSGERITVKSPDEVVRLRAACRVVAEVLDELRGAVVPGITTLELDRLAEEGARRRHAEPAFKGYHGYPASLCASVNEEVVHGIPSSRTLREGDIIGLDFGVVLDGFFGDAAITLPVGRVTEQATRLLSVTREALEAAMAEARPDRRIGDLGAAVQRHVEASGFAVVRDFVGHGIGRRLHEPPQIPNFGTPGTGPRLRAGMALAIEPMVNLGGCEVDTRDDGWTACTVDGLLSAHFEHTVLVTENGPEILTLSPAASSGARGTAG